MIITARVTVHSLPLLPLPSTALTVGHAFNCAACEKRSESHVTLLAWVNEESLPRPDAAVKLGEFLGCTNTPYWEFLEGDLRDLKLLMMDRLTNLLIQLPADAREKVFRQWEASLAEELRYIESSSQSATTETELPV